MGTEKTFISIHQVHRKLKLYRAYRFLSDKEKATLDKKGLAPNQMLLALAIQRSQGDNIRTAIRESKKIIADYNTWLSKSPRRMKAHLTESQAIREFSFMGYQPVQYEGNAEDTVNRWLRKQRLSRKLSYLTSNRPLEGNIWVLPMGFWHNYYDMNKTDAGYIYKALTLYGVEGYTRCKVPDLS